MSQEQQPPPAPSGELSEASHPWWRRYSPHGEFPWSSTMSLVLHVFIILLIIVAATPLLKRDPTPPGVDVIYLSDADNAAPGLGPQPPGEGAMVPSPSNNLPLPVTSQVPIKQMEPLPPEDQFDPNPMPDDFSREAQDAARAARAARDRVKQRMQGQMARNYAAQPAGGVTGGGGGGSGLTGRAARVARWILHFDTQSPTDYLAQLDGLGAAIAFPLKDDQWKYFERSSSGRRSSTIRDLTNEGRLYWLDDKSDSFPAIAQLLGVSSAPFMVVFLPQPLEDKMLRLELSYNNLEEDEIKTTHFKTIKRGGKLEVVVTEQIPK